MADGAQITPTGVAGCQSSPQKQQMPGLTNTQALDGEHPITHTMEGISKK